MNIKIKFKQEYDNITIKKDFNDIKNTLKLNPIIKEPKKNYKPLIYSFGSLAIILVIMIPLLINGFTSKNEPNITDFNNYEVHLNKLSNNTEITNETINITLPMMYNGINLDENININSNYEVLKDGIIQDKDHLNLSLGNNSYDIIIYKMNNIDSKYKLNITVGK